MPILLAAAVTDDCIKYKISNHIIINGFIWGIILILIEMIEMFLIKISITQVNSYIISCAEGLLTPLVLLFPVYLAGGMGAGDIKLLCVMGMVIKGTEIIRIIIIILPVAAGMCIWTIIKCAYLRKHKGMHKIHLSYAIAVSWGIYFIETAFTDVY